MATTVHHHLSISFPDGVPPELVLYVGADTTAVLAAIDALAKKMISIGAADMADVTKQMESLRASVSNGTTITQSMATFVHGLADRLEAALAGGADPAEIQALADQLRANSDTLTAAMLEGTPVEEEPPAETPPVESPTEGSTTARRR